MNASLTAPTPPHPDAQINISDFLLWIGGRNYTRESFIAEALRLGVCRRIPIYPEGLVPGQSRILLISDMSEKDRVRYRRERLKRSALRYKAKKLLSQHKNARELELQLKGPMPRGLPQIFAWFNVGALIYVTDTKDSVPRRYLRDDILIYTQSDPLLASVSPDDLWAAGPPVKKGLYILSEPSLELCYEYASSYRGGGHLNQIIPPLPYSGPRFSGVKRMPRDFLDKIIDRANSYPSSGG